MTRSSYRVLFSHRPFRLVWSAGAAVYLATWLCNVAAAWWMAQLSRSPVLIALIQAAASLPFLLLSLPAGALADRVDRRRVMLAAQAGNVLVCAVVAVLGGVGALGPWGLIAATFALGALLALHGPAAQATVTDVVPPHQVPSAIALNSIAYNLARSAGPGLAGVLMTLTSVPMLFCLTGGLFAVSSWLIHRLPPAAAAPAARPAERLGPALVAGIRYACRTPVLRGTLLRAALFSLGASALWALLPAMARLEMGGSAGLFGLLMGCLGGGAVAAGCVLGRLHEALGDERLMQGGTAAFALATFVLGTLPGSALLYPALVVGGMGWMICNSLLIVRAQQDAPSWMRARSGGLLLVVLMGSMGLGSTGWGLMADLLGPPLTLVGAGIGLCGALMLQRRFPLPAGSEGDGTRVSV
jgi:predicted MFS family arabinose efflux permease